MKSIKFFAAAIMMAQFALPSAAQSSAPDSTGKQVQEIVYEEIKIPRYKESSLGPSIIYINDEWIPNTLGILDSIK